MFDFSPTYFVSVRFVKSSLLWPRLTNGTKNYINKANGRGQSFPRIEKKIHRLNWKVHTLCDRNSRQLLYLLCKDGEGANCGNTYVKPDIIVCWAHERAPLQLCSLENWPSKMWSLNILGCLPQFHRMREKADTPGFFFHSGNFF